MCTVKDRGKDAPGMERLTGWRKFDDWGSQNAISDFLGETPGRAISEIWFGDHPDGPTLLADGKKLADLIASDPKGTLGSGILYAFGSSLPFLMKIIAPEETLSLQVHPTKEIAREGFLREEVLHIPRDDHARSYRDMNHKPEMLYALTDFEALIGFRVPRKARRLLDGLDGELAHLLRRRLQLSTVRGGLRSLAAWVFDEDSPVTPELMTEFAAACGKRLEEGTSPSVRTDRLMVELAQLHGGDPGIILAFLMNPVSLRAGEAAYIPPRQIHAYQRGLGIEVMASCDNVIRAGLTRKHVDSAQLVEIAEFSALPPVRVAPEHPTETSDRFLAPAQEFELTVTKVRTADQWVEVPGEGPRILIVGDGDLQLRTGSSQCSLSRGEAVFVAASEHELSASGDGQLVQCAAP